MAMVSLAWLEDNFRPAVPSDFAVGAEFVKSVKQGEDSYSTHKLTIGDNVTLELFEFQGYISQGQAWIEVSYGGTPIGVDD